MFKEWLHKQMETNMFAREVTHMCYDAPLLAVALSIAVIMLGTFLSHMVWYLLIHRTVFMIVSFAVTYLVWRVVKWFGNEYKSYIQ